MSFELECDEVASTIRGSGSDNLGTFTVIGLFDEQTIRFVKSYSGGGQRWQWTYVGQRRDAQNPMIFQGGWGTNGKQYGTFVLAGSFFSLAGQWRGNYYYHYNPTLIDPPMDIQLKVEAERVYGSGIDWWGPFTIEGTVEGQKFNATKAYENKIDWQWQGIVTARNGRISGSWGGTGHEGGTFEITKEQTGEPSPMLSAETALALLPAQEELWGGNAGQVASNVGEELGTNLLQTLLTGFTSFMS